MNAPQEIDRRTFLGGSDIAAIYGLSPYKTAVELWLEKTGRRSKPKPSKYQQRLFDRGHRLEPIIVEMTLDKLRDLGHDVELIATNKRYQDSVYPFLACEIDFELMLDGEHINGDAKSVSGFARQGWGDEEFTDQIPLHYHAQFMHGLGITGRRRCLVSALMGLDDVALYWADRDDDLIESMRTRAVEFWNDCVVGGKVPDFMKFDDVKAIYPVDNGKSCAATEEIAGKVARLASINQKIAAWDAEKEGLQLDIAEFISPYSILIYEGRPILTWKAQEMRRLDGAALEEEHPDIAAKFKTLQTIRVMRLKKERA